MREFPTAVAAFKEGEITDADLYRTIMAWPHWMVATTLVPDADGGVSIAILRDPQGFSALEAFSDQEAFDAFVEREEDHIPARLTRIDGYRLFGDERVAALNRVNLDLHSPHASHFYASQLPLLQAWARITEVELALTVPDRIPHALDVVRRFGEFRILVRKHGEERGLVLAPDANDRSLAAVFTADDLLDAFITEVEGDLEGELEVEHKAGRELFAELGAMGLDGVVFNPFTSMPAVALDARIFGVLGQAPGAH